MLSIEEKLLIANNAKNNGTVMLVSFYWGADIIEIKGTIEKVIGDVVVVKNIGTPMHDYVNLKNEGTIIKQYRN